MNILEQLLDKHFRLKKYTSQRKAASWRRYTAQIENCKAVNPKNTPNFDEWVDVNHAESDFVNSVPGTSGIAWTIIHSQGSEPHIKTNGLKFASADGSTFSIKLWDAWEMGDFSEVHVENLQYSLDDGLTWVPYDYTVGADIDNVTEILWKADRFETPVDDVPLGFTFSNHTSVINMIGDITWLCGHSEELLPGTTFQYMFESSGAQIDASNLYLPNNTTPYCYYSMFFGSCIAAPALPATALSECCYLAMFSACSSLTSAPALYATTLTPYCYHSMFSGCTSLTTAPALPATTLDNYCYHSMFSGCTSLTTAPALPATTLTPYCYHQMFNGCTSLTTAPVLPATTLAENCYEGMFKGCTSLTTAPELPAITLVEYCYDTMFDGCSSLNDVTIYASDTSAPQCLYAWLRDTAASGTVHCKLTFPDASVPSGWIKDGSL